MYTCISIFSFTLYDALFIGLHFFSHKFYLYRERLFNKEIMNNQCLWYFQDALKRLSSNFYVGLHSFQDRCNFNTPLLNMFTGSITKIH